MVAAAPLFFSIIVLSIREPKIEQQEYSYSVNIEIRTNCVPEHVSNIVLSFVPSREFGNVKSCSSPFQRRITCGDLTHGAHYTINGYLQYGGDRISLSPRVPLYQITTPKYINSTSTPTSIHTFFLLPGFFNRLIVEIRSVGKFCDIEHSKRTSPFYNCSLLDLNPTESYNLTYYSVTQNQQRTPEELKIVNTEDEQLNFTCQLKETDKQIIYFSWNFRSRTSTDLTMFILIKRDPVSWEIPCNPNPSQGICSTEQYHLEPGTEYQITANLTKPSRNYKREKIGGCSIKTNLSKIPENSIQHKFVNQTTIRLNWPEYPFSVKVQLRNPETNLIKAPMEINETSALFTNLTGGSVFRVGFYISKENYSSINQTTNYFIQTNFTKLILRDIVRLSENSLMVSISEYKSPKIEIMYCIEKIFENNSRYCSHSNRFTQLASATIYNVSVTIHRDPFEKKFSWKKQTVFKLVNTNLPQLKTRPWKTNETCGVELLNNFTLNYSTECTFNERNISCDELRCGCEYEMTIKFNETMINSLCSSSHCDIQLNNPSFTVTKVKTPLDTVKNLQIVNDSLAPNGIEVQFDNPSGCYEDLILICEGNSPKERKNVSNSRICRDLKWNGTYRIYVETKRNGWETVPSNPIENKLTFISNSDQGTTKSRLIIISCIIGFFILSGLFGFLIIYRWRRRKQLAEEWIARGNNENTIVNINGFVNHLERPIRIQDLIEEYKNLIVDECFQGSNEFEKLQNNLQDIPPLTEHDEPSKNRYKNIIPYEHTRVKLNPLREFDSRYINASFINGLNGPHEYIACQGPLKTTINDHWRMIWEQNVAIIVMLTRLSERGMSQCERYLPVELDLTVMFGDISICVTSYVNLLSYDLRHIQLRKSHEVRFIKHYAFKMWSHNTLPTNTDELMSFIRLIRSEYRPEEMGPMLVHCSAGVGRSGTFIALDRLLQQFDKLPFDGYLDIYGTVLDMRRCRNKIVRTKDEYLFLYRCLKEEFERTSGKSIYEPIC